MATLTRQLTRFFSSIIFVCALATSALATLVPRMTVEEMAGEAELVVHGNVVRKWSAWDSSGGTIWTHYEIRIEETLKGASGGALVVSEPGGIVGDQGMMIPGTPQYNVGDEVVLLVWRTPIGYLRTSGWGQGKFTVSAAAGGVKVARASTSLKDVELFDAQKAGAPRRAGTAPSALDGLPLQEFKTRLKALVSTVGAK
jgi:hypothetical protein